MKLTKTRSPQLRQLVSLPPPPVYVSERNMTNAQHPMSQHAPEVLHCIKFVRLDFITRELEAPVPRNQEMPPEAFGELTDSTVLVATSHGWFFSGHPDPKGAKLDLIRSFFAPQMKARYPNTRDVLVFDDWLCCPQYPRTEAEQAVFSDAMRLMNQVSSFPLHCFLYVYLAVVSVREGFWLWFCPRRHVFVGYKILALPSNGGPLLLAIVFLFGSTLLIFMGHYIALYS